MTSIKSHGGSRPDLTVLSRARLSGILRAADVVAVLLSGCLFWVLRSGGAAIPPLIGVMLLNSVLLTAGLFHLAGLYEDRRETPRRHAIRVIGCWALVGGILLFGAFITKMADELSRAWIGAWFAATPGLLLASRLIFCWRISGGQAHWRHRTRIALVGPEPPCRHLIEQLSDRIEVLGRYWDEPDSVTQPLGGEGTIRDLIARCRVAAPDRIILVLPWNDEATIIRLLSMLQSVPVAIDLAPPAIASLLPGTELMQLEGLSMLSLRQPPLDPWNVLVKVIEDRLLAGALIVPLLPVMLLIAILVKLDSPGPVLFRQRRYGYNHRVITVTKFRTMYHRHGADDDVPQARRADPRVTRIGALLRRTSLDELPQFFNVLGGSMSLVGPRPHAIPHDDYYSRLIEEYAARHNVKPGITGWAQINGFRGETPTPELMRRRVEHDLHYIRNWSLSLDLWILIRTAAVCLTGEQAY